MGFKELMKRIWKEEGGYYILGSYYSAPIPKSIYTKTAPVNYSKPVVGSGGYGSSKPSPNAFIAGANTNQSSYAPIPTTKGTTYPGIPTVPNVATPIVNPIVDPIVGTGVTGGGIETGGEIGGGGTALSGVQFPQFNIGMPDLSWNPTEGQRGTWLEEAMMRAGLQIDPQVQGREQGLSRFRNAAEANRTELNPRYDRMSSAVANVFKNVVDQALVNNAIRRGAAGSGTSSGWLGQERIRAGEAELGQRKGIEGERNQVLNAINSQVLNKEQETSDALQGLEGLRGKQTDVNYADLERLARGDFLQEKQGTFENELQNAIFQGGYSTDQANFLLNKFNSESSASLGQADLALRGRETSLNEALGQYNMRPSAGYSAAPSPYTINVGGQDVPVSTSQYLNYWQNQNSGAETPAEKALREALERL